MRRRRIAFVMAVIVALVATARPTSAVVRPGPELPNPPVVQALTTIDQTPFALLSSGVAVQAVVTGESHTCALTTAGGVKCWGNNRYGQLGDGSTTNRSEPVDVVGLTSGVAAIDAGGDHTCAVTTGGALLCWGRNFHGQLGDGTTQDRPKPGYVTNLSSGVAAVSCGGNHTCARTTAGGAKCWGYNNYHKLGNECGDICLTPMDVVGLTTEVASLSAGGEHTCAVTTGGGVKCWGNNLFGQIGDGTFGSRAWKTTPVDVSGLSTGVAAVAAGAYHTCALTVGGGVKCWGYNDVGQVGDGTNSDRTTPVASQGVSSDVATLTVGDWHTCVVLSSGRARCWGENNGKLGDGTFENRYTPVDVAGLASGTVAVAGGHYHSCAVLVTGGVKCWGGNYDGQIGDGTTILRFEPTDVSGLGGAALSVTHVEVTQAIQDDANGVPLITGKPTFARVYVRATAGQSIFGITGTLRGFGPSGELPGSPLLPVNRSVTAYDEDWSAQRGELEKTLNFTLPASWANGTVTLRAEVGSAVLTPDPSVFQPSDALRVIYAPIRYQGQEPDSARIRTNYSWAQRVFPTNRIEYVPANQTVEWDMCLNKDQCPDTFAPSARLLELHLSTLALLQDCYVFGWLPEGSYNGGQAIGIGWGQAAIGDDHHVVAPRIFAHEMGHLLGRRHPSRECPNEGLDPETDWPQDYPNSTIQTFGLDGWGFGWLASSDSAVKDPADTYDYMSACEPLSMDRVWTSPWTYKRLSDRLQSQATNAQMTSEPTPQAIVSGIVYSDGQATIEPLWVVEGSGASVTPPGGTTYCLEFHDAAGTPMVQQCFDLDFRDPATYEPGDMAIYSLRLPYPAGTARVVLRSGSQELASRTVSTSVPEVTVLAPAAGETWNEEGTSSVAWAATDADGDPLAFYVMYSHDGEDWIPVSGPITETQVALDVSRLPGSEAARIRVLASDGARTGMGESGLFSTGRKAPSVDILAPESAGSVPPETELLLQGWAHDLEDGVLEGASLTWRSDVDGGLGTGTTILVSLSPGHHTVSLGATDSDGNTTVASTQVSVGQWVYLPLSLKQ